MQFIYKRYSNLGKRVSFYHILYFLLVPFLLTQTACKKFVAVPPPVSLVVTANTFNNDANATAAQIAIYEQMSGESYYMASSTGLLGDELTNYGTTPTSQEFFANAMDPITINAFAGCWANAYSYIYQANAIIEGLASVSGASAYVKQQLTGESKFIRAFWLFYLTNEYGDVPLVTSTNYAVNQKLPRAPRAQVYLQIIADLKDAQTMLNTGYVDLSDTANSTVQKLRPNQAAATALLARAYLYSGDSVNAEIQASAVIGNSTYTYTLEPNLNNVFLTASRESIWQIQIALPGANGTFDGGNFILTGAPPVSNTISTSISLQLLSSFEPGDKRRTNWIHDTTFAAAPYSYACKYKAGGINVPQITDFHAVTEEVVALRLGEQYLIRAEARARNGNSGGAVADLNIIRERAGLTDYTGPTDKTTLLSVILHERQVELFTEWGNRWFDMQRFGVINSVMGAPGNVCQSKGGAWASDNHQWLFPIPLAEMQNDPNLSQNPGY